MTDEVRQPSLLDEELRPVPFQLTAKARRVVAPTTLPDLAVLPGGGRPATSGGAGAAVVTGREGSGTAPPAPDGPEPSAEVDDHDPRPVRARALYRAGRGVRHIAAELRVAPEDVAAWIDDVERPRPATVRPVPNPGEPTSEEAPPTAWVTAHAAALASDRDWLDPAFTQGAGLVVALAEISHWAVVLRAADVDVLARALDWLRGQVDLDDRDVRVHVRVAPGAPFDRATSQVAERLRVDPGQLTRSRWHDAGHHAQVDVRVRIAQPRLAGRVAAWRERVLGPSPFADHPQTRAG